MMISINIYFFWSSKSLSWFCFLGFIENKFFGVNLMVSQIFSFFHFVSWLSHVSHHGRELADYIDHGRGLADCIDPGRGLADCIDPGRGLADYINLPLSVYPVVACQSK